jgi:hypothetical protein
MISITPSDEKTAFIPGESIRGTLGWSCPGALSRLELRLFWRTSGKGTADTKIVDSIRWEGMKAGGDHKYAMSLPMEPYSFSGKLISLIWALEAVAEGLDFRETALLDIVISPDGGEIILWEAGGGEGR